MKNVNPIRNLGTNVWWNNTDQPPCFMALSALVDHRGEHDPDVRPMLFKNPTSGITSLRSQEQLSSSDTIARTA
jgi:hypothetical protein